MRKICSINILALALALLAVPAVAQVSEEVGGAPTANSPNGIPGPIWAGPEGTVLVDNGPLLTDTGIGCGGLDQSTLENLALGMTTLGFANQGASGNRMADDFTIPTGEMWQIDTCTFFDYQTGGPTTPTTTAIVVQIWDGRPGDPGSNVVFGDLVTNVLDSASFTSIYRAAESASGDCARPIYANVATIGTTLGEGTYWLDWSPTGSAAFSGPWAPPVTIPGQTMTGNGRQFFSGAWQDAADGGTLATQALPFICEGVVAGDSDIEVSKSGQVSGGNVIYTVTVTNNGPDDATNVMVTDTPGPGQTYVSDDCGGMFAAPDWTWNVGALANGASAVCNITYALDAGVSSVSNSVSATADQMDPNTGNNATSITVSTANVLEIPTLGQWGLILLTLALLGAGMMLLMRRRTA